MHLNNFQASGDDKFTNYQPKRAFLFPGQGAQTVGMAKVSGSEAIRSTEIAWLWFSGAEATGGGCRTCVLTCPQPRRFLIRPLRSWATIC